MKNWQESTLTSPSKRMKQKVVATNVWVFGSVTAVLLLTLYPFTFEEFSRIHQLQRYVSGFDTGGYSRCCTHLAVLEPLANIVLFLPVGVGLSSLFRQRAATWRRTFVTVVVLCFCLSFAVEFLQIFQPWRSASLADVLMNSTGGGLGFLGVRLVAFCYRTLFLR